MKVIKGKQGETIIQYEQIIIFDLLKTDQMYDGYEVKHSVNIHLDVGGIYSLLEGQIFYLISKHSNSYSIALPNEFGGSCGITVNEKQFKSHFRALGRKVYPKSKNIWNGKAWINNPQYIC